MAGQWVRSAAPTDVGMILTMIQELAEYERRRHEVTATEDRLREHLFGPRPFAEALVTGIGDAEAGYALFHHSYSTFLGQPSLHLEDVFVRPAFRGRGLGKRLLAEVARLAVQRGCGRYEWTVLDWNESAIRFYEQLGACMQTDWRVMRVTGADLTRLASLADG